MIVITSGLLFIAAGIIGAAIALIFLLSSPKRFKKQRKKLLDQIENRNE